MTELNIAHIREQGVDLIMVIVNPSFGAKPLSEQQQIANALQRIATHEANLAGTVVPVWLDQGRPRFLAHREFLPFLQSITWDYVLARVNRKITVSD